MSYRTSRRSAHINRSKSLSESYDKMRPGRGAMRTIWDRWATRDKSITTLAQRDREEFQEYYNANYHDTPSGSETRGLSDEIHRLMHDLDHTVDRIARGEFTQIEVMQTFGHAIAMDQHLIRIYLEAHWRHHQILDQPLKDRFWKNVPTIVENAASWKENSEKTT